MDFSFSVSSRSTASYNGERTSVKTVSEVTCGVCETTAHLSLHPVAQGHHLGGFGGLGSAQLQGSDAAAEPPEGVQALLVPFYSRFISLFLLKIKS